LLICLWNSAWHCGRDLLVVQFTSTYVITWYNIIW
jgi:hypothetical protein